MLCFSQLGRLVALGSSTTAGFAVPADSCWVARFNKYYRTQLGVIDNTYNLGVGGNTMYSAMPSSYVNVIRPIQPDPSINVTKANQLLKSVSNPSKGIVIVNFPSNGYDYMPITEVLNALQIIYDSATRLGNKCFVTTTQPRTSGVFGTSAIKKKMVQLKDAIIGRFGIANTLNFFDGMYNPADTSILTAYSLGDGTHFNSAGHRELFRRVAAKNVFNLPGPAEGDYKSNTTQGSWSAASSWVSWNGLNWIGVLVPPASQDITISPGHRINITSNTVVSGNLTVNGILDAGSFSIDFKKNLVNNGSLNNLGLVSFSGPTLQSIAGTSVTTFLDLSVSNVAGLSIESNQNLAGKLTLSANSVMDVDGASNSSVFKILSTADSPTSDASIAPLPAGASLIGKLTVQRFMSQEGQSFRVYRNIASPVRNASVADLQNEIPVTGNFLGASNCSGCTSSPSMFSYNETQTPHSNLASGYVPFPQYNNTETMSSGAGYSLYVRGNLLASAAWDLRGEMVHANLAPFSFPVSFTNTGVPLNDGWNFVGNPFVSAIHWEAAGWAKTNIDASIYIRDNSAQPPRYATWNGTIGTNGGTPIIAMGQGFWIKANGPPSLTAAESVKTANSTTFFRTEALTNLLRIVLSKEKAEDETAIHFREGATGRFDAGADAWKLQNDLLNIGSLSAIGQKLSINSWSPLVCDTTISLATDFSVEGTYFISFKNVESFDSDVTIELFDRKSNTRSIVTGDTFKYQFYASSDPADQNRFVLNFKKKPLPIKIIADGGKLKINETGLIQWYFNGQLLGGETKEFIIPQLSGIYSVNLRSGDGCKLSGSIDYLVTELPDESMFLIYPNPTTNQVFVYNPRFKDATLTVTDLLGRVVSKIGLPTHEYCAVDLSATASGLYLFHILASDISLLKLVAKQ